MEWKSLLRQISLNVVECLISTSCLCHVYEIYHNYSLYLDAFSQYLMCLMRGDISVCDFSILNYTHLGYCTSICDAA